MKLSEVDGEKYLSFLHSLLFIYTFLHEWCQSWLTWCVCLCAQDARGAFMTAGRPTKTRQDARSSTLLSNFCFCFFFLINEDQCRRIHETHYHASVLWNFVETFSPCGAAPEPPELTASFLKDEREDSSCFKVSSHWSFVLVSLQHADRQTEGDRQTDRHTRRHVAPGASQTCA